MTATDAPQMRQEPSDAPERPDTATDAAESRTALPRYATGHHIGRSWTSRTIEDDCPCPQEPCGLVNQDTVSPDCGHHPWTAAKSIRQSHPADQCPGSVA